MTERMPTGIQGLDPLVEGGLIRGDMHILAGAPGTGKTIFATAFAYNAASKLNDKVVYASFEESTEYLKRNVKKLGVDFGPLEQTGKVRLLDLDALRGKELEANIHLLLTAVKETGSSLLVIDSLTALLLATESKLEMRTFMKTMYRTLKSESVTTLLTVSQSQGSPFGLEAFVADSVMFLENWMGTDQFKTRLNILKMRGTDHSRRYHLVTFTPTIGVSKY